VAVILRMAEIKTVSAKVGKHVFMLTFKWMVVESSYVLQMFNMAISSTAN